jgi:protein-disulfide isomerase
MRVLVLAVAVAVIPVSGCGGKQASDKPPPQAAQVEAMFRGIPQHGQTLGYPRAPVTLYEFADLKCPICRTYTLGALPTLLRKYVRPGKLKIVFQPQTFVGSPPGDSERGARFALAAGKQDKLWQFAELWYRYQRGEGTAYATDDYIRWIASGVPGLNVDRALAERNSPPVTQALSEASGLFNAGHFPGTPSFALAPTGQVLRPLPATTNPAQFTGPVDRLLER